MGTETIPKSEEAVVAESPSNLELQIIRQIEYYFGNYNLSRDKFLREQLKLDDGWVPLETMVKFNRLKKLSDDFNVITEALKKSSRQLMEINEDCTKIRRQTEAPIPEDYRTRQNELDELSLYVKGFKKNITLDELLDFFKEHGVEHVAMRRNMQAKEKPFKGSVFVTFEAKAAAEKFLGTKGIKYKGTELLKEWKKDYVTRKDEYYNNLRAEKEKKMLKKSGLEKKDGKSDPANADGEKSETVEVQEEQVLKDMIPGCLLKLTNFNGDTSREKIKTAFEPHGNLVYIDYHIGNPTAVIRFETGIASSVLEKLDEEEGEKNIQIGSSKVKVTAIEGDEEKNYWTEIAKNRLLYRQKHSRYNKSFENRGRFKKGKRQRYRGDKNEKDDESVEPPKKKTKSEVSEESKELGIDKKNCSDESVEPPTKKIKSEVSEQSKELAIDKKDCSETINVKIEVPEIKTES